ncbi:MAG: hypothetical protein A2189_05355 [Paenibacillus sp. RIFOXYA1_FULL_44_5]|nr:MAG: hypothetical protein A2189_05355 [Paenibacillus sp. RIFOXYA1_FULL_44_5]
MANRIMRLIFLVLTAFFRVPGFIIGITGWLIFLTLHRSYNTPYMWPFIPFNAKAMYTLIIREPVTSKKSRPSITKPLDNSRAPKKK